MITNSKLNCFGPDHTVDIDQNLAKYSSDPNNGKVNIIHEATGVTIPLHFGRNSVMISGNTGSWEANVEPKKSWKDAVINFFKKRELKPKDNYVDVIEVFNNVKTELNNLKLYKDRAEGYTKLILKAKQSGQLALVQKLARQAVVYQHECVLYSEGIVKYIKEDDLVKAARNSERGLHLTYIKNYVRMIPDHIQDLRDKADNLKVFDNFVILHFDPEKKNVEHTHEEKKVLEAKKKDPILFGLISGSDKLYYIGDWIDEVCDLTWDKLADLVCLKESELKVDK